MTKIEPPHNILELKQLAQRILKAIKKKNQIIYKGKPIKRTADFSTETLKAKRTWSEES
jgi:hypothetical protein